jgi:hypothetical protein
MKNSLLIILAIYLVAILSQCDKDENKERYTNSQSLTIRRSWSQVIERAKDFGYEKFEDYAPQSEIKHLLTKSDANLDKFFIDAKPFIMLKLEGHRFIRECLQINCASEYYTLLEKYPYVQGFLYKTDKSIKTEHHHSDSLASNMKTLNDFEVDKKLATKSGLRFFIQRPMSEENPYNSLPTLVILAPRDEYVIDSTLRELTCADGTGVDAPGE